MVRRKIKWRPWNLITTKKFQVKLSLWSLAGLPEMNDAGRLGVHIKWKGRKGKLGSKLGGVRRNCTAMQCFGENGIVEWNETFNHVCDLIMIKENIFLRWVIRFEIISAADKDQKNRPPILGAAFLDIAEFASLDKCTNETLSVINFPCCYRGKKSQAELTVGVQLLNLQCDKEYVDPIQRFLIPLACMGSFATLKDGFQDSINKPEKYSSDDDTSGFKPSPLSEEFESADLFDSESTEECDMDENDEAEVAEVDNSFTYDTLAAANLSAGLLYVKWDEDDDNLSNGLSANPSSFDSLPRLIDEPSSSDSDYANQQNSMRRLISWKKRKFSFKSPKAKGEPLLNKECREMGGDDIDFCRRQSESPTYSPQSLDYKSVHAETVLSAFGDDQFTIGSWEKRELISRDGQMKLSTHVFFGSIDQRHERAAGESACTALVAVIADWLHANPGIMPNRSQFDMLIREGSQEWRKLCDSELYRDRFPDKHFDLDTILEAKVRPLSVIHERSFVGFFSPDGVGDSFDFLQGAMTFDNIWDEISKDDIGEGSSSPQIYIVSWNDHFFILKVEREALYVIDTLGERLFEGCNQAYILKFDKDTEIYQLPPKVQEKPPRKGSASSSPPPPPTQDSKAPAKTKFASSALSKELKSATTDLSKSSDSDGKKVSKKEGSKSPKKEGSKSPLSKSSKFFNVEPPKSPRLESLKSPKADGSVSPKLEQPMSPKVGFSASAQNSTSFQEGVGNQASQQKSEGETNDGVLSEETENKDDGEKLVSKGKEACKAFITGFLAALPLRELQVDMQKGLMGKTTIHHRLQIEFDYTCE